MAGLRRLQAQFPSVITDVRGLGLMIGVEFDTHEHSAAVEWAAFQRGLLTLECGHSVIRIAPPLVLTEAEAAVGLELFGEAVAEVAAKA
jgi:4-aminobutyrate aminotransferase